MKDYFFKLIYNTRHNHETVLYRNVLEFDYAEIAKTRVFLESQYLDESVSYQSTPPTFDGDAAIWASKIFYYSSQLLLYREHKIDEIHSLIIPYNKEISASAILSADLILRFVPDVLRELKLIDNTDPLITILEEILAIWHYSGIKYKDLDIENIKFDVIKSDQSLLHQYIDRVIECKNTKLAKHTEVEPYIASALGMYSKELWPNFK